MKTLKGLYAAFVVALLGLAFADANAQNYGHSSWFNKDYNGEGTFCNHQGKTMFCVWFMYDEAGRGRFLALAGDLVRDDKQRDILSGDLFRATGVQPMHYDPTRRDAKSVGQGSLVFDSESSATLTFSFTNESGTLQTGERKLAPFNFDRTGKLHYVNKVYARYTGHYPYVVTKSGLTKVKNMTGFTYGAIPLGGCAFYETSIENGIVPVKCIAASDGAWHKLYIDPTTDELHVYRGPYVFDESKFHQTDWDGSRSLTGSALLTRAGIPDRPGSYAEVADGVFYQSTPDSWTLKFYSANSGTTHVIATGDPLREGGFDIVMKYSNP